MAFKHFSKTPPAPITPPRDLTRSLATRAARTTRPSVLVHSLSMAYSATIIPELALMRYTATPLAPTTSPLVLTLVSIALPATTTSISVTLATLASRTPSGSDIRHHKSVHQRHQWGHNSLQRPTRCRCHRRPAWHNELVPPV